MFILLCYYYACRYAHNANISTFFLCHSVYIVLSNTTSTGKLTQNPLQNTIKGRANHYFFANFRRPKELLQQGIRISPT